MSRSSSFSFPPSSSSRRPVLVLALVCVLAAVPGLAAAGQVQGGSESLLLAQILVLVFVGKLLGEGMLRLGQPQVMGELAAGILLGASVLGVLWPEGQKALFPDDPAQKSMIEAIAQFGILMLLLLAGMETDLALVKRIRRPAMAASLAGIVVPFACGFALGEFLPDALLPDPERRFITSLFLGTALSISSVKIVASVVREMGFIRRDLGQVILAAAIVDDTIGWIIIATTLSLAEHGSFDWLSVGKSVGGTALFLVASFTFGRRLVFHAIRWTNDNLRGEAPVIAVILLIMGAMALTTHLIGVHTVLGAFVAGILIGESPILTRQIDEQLRGLTAGLFMPVFFGLAGLSSDLSVLLNQELALLTLTLILIASLGKTLGAFAGGYFGGLGLRESTALATGMNARGATEVIVATIGLSLGVISQDLYTMIVAMALVTTLAMPPSLRWALTRLPVRRDEQQRIDRESFERQGFVPQLERILLVAALGPQGRIAARIAGLLAGARGMPVTLLQLDDVPEAPQDGAGAGASKPEATTPDDGKAKPDGKRRAGDKEPGRDPGAEGAADVFSTQRDVLMAAAAAARPHDAERDKDELSLNERRAAGAPQAAIAAEARKGHDLLVVGLERAVTAGGEFDDRLSQIAAAFDGALAIVLARGALAQQPEHARLAILNPLTGSEPSRRGTEMAMALAKAAGAPVRALVTAAGAVSTQHRRVSQGGDEEEIAKEVRQIGRYFAKRVRVSVRTDVAAEDAILREVRSGRHDLVVLGVSRRPGANLSLGPLARALAARDDISLLFVVPQRAGRTAETAEAPVKVEAAPDGGKTTNPGRKRGSRGRADAG